MRSYNEDLRLRYVFAQAAATSPLRALDAALSMKSGIERKRQTRLTTGSIMNVYLPALPDVLLYVTGDYEPPVTKLLANQLGINDVVINVGAHHGLRVRQSLDKVGSGGLILAVEPTPRSFEILQENCPETNVVLKNVALGNRIGTAELQILPPGFSGSNSIKRIRLNEQEHGAALAQVKKIDVPLTRLDNLIGELAISPRMIVIDAENSEYDILEGAQETLAQHHPNIIFEGGDDGRDETNNTRRCLDLLSHHNYEFYTWSRKYRTRHHEPLNHYSQGNNPNILAVSKHRLRTK